MSNYIIYMITRITLIHSVYFLSGLLVKYWNIRVNYTRKITHFAIFFVPELIKPFFPHENSLLLSAASSLILFLSFFIYIAPLRTIFFTKVAFASFDRPEDRPYTLLWAQSQLFFTLVIATILSWYFSRNNMGSLMMIPFLIVGLGDGLAEPVGVRFGKHKYRTKALFTKRLYTRSLEGSACVFLSSFLAIYLYKNLFSTKELVVMFLITPLLATIVEAKSPHTWDAPFIFLIIGIVTYIIKIIF